MKSFFLGLFALLIVSSAHASLDAPFNIVIGSTRNSEIENRGVCIKQIRVSGNSFRCEEYNMAGGKFRVHSSQNEIVTKIEFFSGYDNVLPQSWKNEGLEISYNYGPASSKYDLNRVLSRIPHTNKVEKIVPVYQQGMYLERLVVTFDIGAVSYEIHFTIDSDDNSTKMFRVFMTEVY